MTGPFGLRQVTTKTLRRALTVLTWIAAIVAVMGMTSLVACAEEKTRVLLWHYTRDDGGMRAVAEAFERAHPDIDVVLEHMGDFRGEKFFVAQAGGVGPDVVWADGTLVTSWALAGAIQPLTRWVERADLSRSDFIGPSWDQALWNGEVWALPLYVDANFALTYNKDMLDAAGVLPPKTVWEMSEMQPKLARTDADGNLVQIGFVPWDVHGMGNAVYTWGWAFGGKFYDPQTQQITANHPNVVRALEWMAEPAQHWGFENVHNLLRNMERGYDSLMSRRVAMRPEHLGIIRGWIEKRTPDLNYGLAPIPYDPGQVDGPQTWIGGFTLVMAAQAKNPDAAWEFIRYVCATPEGTRLFAEDGGFPGFKDCPVMDLYATDPVASFFLQVLQTAKHARPPIPNQGFYYSQLNKKSWAVMRGESPAKPVLDEITRIVQADLDEILAKVAK